MTSNDLLAKMTCAVNAALGEETACDVAAIMLRYGDERVAEAHQPPVHADLPPDDLRHFMANGQENAS